jgi:O-antigen/teichoic acid export membrane protein
VRARETAELGRTGRTSGIVARAVEALAGTDASTGDVKALRSVVLGTVGTVSLNAVTVAVNFLLAVVLARTLGTAGYGAYAVALAWAMFLSVPASLGITPLVVRHVAAYVEREEWGLLRGVIRRTNQTVAAAAATVVAVAALVGLALRDSRPELVEPFLIGLLLVPVIALTGMRQAAVQGLHRVVLARLPETVLLPGTFLLLALAGSQLLGSDFTASWAIALNVAAAAFAFAVGAASLRWALPSQVRRSAPAYEHRDWVRSAVPLLALALLFAVKGQIGTILLGAFDSAQSAGMFNVAVRASTFTGFLFLAASYALYPNVARLWTVDDPAAIQRLLTRAVRVVSIFSICVALVFFLFAPQILRVFGGEFAEADLALRILVLGELVKVLMGFGGLALVMTSEERAMAWGTGVGVALNVVLALVLIPLWGLNGAAVASAVSAVASALCVSWLSWTRLGIYGPLPWAKKLSNRPRT